MEKSNWVGRMQDEARALTSPERVDESTLSQIQLLANALLPKVFAEKYAEQDKSLSSQEKIKGALSAAIIAADIAQANAPDRESKKQAESNALGLRLLYGGIDDQQSAIKAIEGVTYKVEALKE